jgi:hypothetical protein
MAKPLRSIRLTPKSDYARFTGSRGEIFYDPVNQTLRIFNSQIVGGEILATRTWVLANTSDFTVDSLRSNSDINVDINLADSTLQRWRFGEDGELTFPDGTAQITAYTGIPGPYVDDAAAALAGVSVGNPYYQVSGQVFVRLS